jgi:hypothetical protein
MAAIGAICPHKLTHPGTAAAAAAAAANGASTIVPRLMKSSVIFQKCLGLRSSVISPRCVANISLSGGCALCLSEAAFVVSFCSNHAGELAY